MSVLDSLRVSEDKKKYIVEILNPILEELIAECISRVPEDPVVFMIDWLRRRQGSNEGNDSLVAENVRLKKEVTNLTRKVEETGQFLATHLNKNPDAHSDSEEDAESDVESLPEFIPQKKKGCRTSVSAEVYGANNLKGLFSPPIHLKTPGQKTRLRMVLDSNFMFSNLEENDKKVLVDAMEEKQFEASGRLIKQGDYGEYLFVIETGVLQVSHEKDGVETKLKELGPGDFFGELALLYNCPRAASIDSLTLCTLWQLGRDTFNHIIRASSIQKRERYEQFLAQVPLLASFGVYERSQIADALKPEVYEDGATIVKQNDLGDRFYLVESGQAVAEQESKGKVMDYHTGDYFGELALIRNQQRLATVKAVGKVTVLSMNRGAFTRLLGPLNEFLEKRAQHYVH